MTEICFYHLDRRKPEEALPAILEQALAQELNVVVQAPDGAWIDALGRASLGLFGRKLPPARHSARRRAGDAADLS